MGYIGCGGFGRFRREWVRLLVKEWAFTVIIINSTHRSWTSWQYDVSFSSSRTAAKSCSDTATWKGKKKTIVNIYYSTVNNYDVVKYNLSYVKCKTLLVSGLPCCRRAEWLVGLHVVTWFYSSAVEVNLCSRVLGPFWLCSATSLPAPPPSLW